MFLKCVLVLTLIKFSKIVWNASCFRGKDQKSTKNLFDLTPILTTAIISSLRNLPPRSIGRTDDQGTCLKGSDA